MLDVTITKRQVLSKFECISGASTMKLLIGINGIWHGLKLTTILLGPEIENMR
jgi:hypothetical protein